MEWIKVSGGFSGKLLHWLTQNEKTYCYLNSNPNSYPDSFRLFDEVFAFGGESIIKPTKYKLDTLQTAINQKKWLFGFLGYDLKNELEDLQSANPNKLDLPDLLFFEPRVVLEKKGDSIRFLKGEKERKVILQNLSGYTIKKHPLPKLTFKESLTKEEYLSKINGLKLHIQRGDIYEVNFCQDYIAQVTELDVFSTYQAFNKLSPVPFSGVFKHNDLVHFSASPERYITKRGNKLISQPIKGTRKRGKTETEDIALFDELKNSLKDKTENVMIVDLVRNDLSRTAAKSSVEVKELCKVYKFPQVFQMISTITSELKKGVHPLEAIKMSFPMGSMTGAPKISAMKIIEEYEGFKRGWYSGSLGYFTPNGDFDFNVVIRSLSYNQKLALLQYAVGGAITAMSDAEEEYEECLTKASALKQLFSKNLNC